SSRSEPLAPARLRRRGRIVAGYHDGMCRASSALDVEVRRSRIAPPSGRHYTRMRCSPSRHAGPLPSRRPHRIDIDHVRGRVMKNTAAESKAVAKAAASTAKIRMTPSEACVETLVAQGVKDTFGIVGSAYMDAHDLFPLAGIRFISVAHEQNAAHMADGYSRVTGKHGVCIAQNGPGI